MSYCWKSHATAIFIERVGHQHATECWRGSFVISQGFIPVILRKLPMYTHMCVQHQRGAFSSVNCHRPVIRHGCRSRWIIHAISVLNNYKYNTNSLSTQDYNVTSMRFIILRTYFTFTTTTTWRVDFRRRRRRRRRRRSRRKICLVVTCWERADLLALVCDV